MSRYRAPRPKSSPYITPEGAEKLRTELHQLWKIERPRVTAQVHEAAKNGDRSENGDYIYGKRRLREIDNRVRHLNKRLEEITVVEATPTDPGRIFFGARVTLEVDSSNRVKDNDNLSREVNYRLVGADEIDPSRGHISIDSPLARALLGKTVNSNVELSTATTRTSYCVLAIHYAD